MNQQQKDEWKSLISTSITDAIGLCYVQRDQPKIELYNGSPERDVLKWIQNFKLQAKSRGWTAAQTIQKFPVYLADAALIWYQLEVENVGQQFTTLNALLDALKARFLPINYKTYLREQLNSRAQSKNEPVYNYIIAKRKLCLDFDDQMSDADQIDYIIDSLQPEIACAVEAMRPTTIEGLIELTRGIERGFKRVNKPQAVSNNNSLMNGKEYRALENVCKTIDSLADELDQLKAYDDWDYNKDFVHNEHTRELSNYPKWDRFDYRLKDRDQRPKYDEFPYPRSDYPSHSSCPLEDFSIAKYGNGKQAVDSREDKLPKYSFPNVNCLSSNEEDAEDVLLFTNILINGAKIPALVDTGSNLSLMSESVALDLKLNISYNAKRQAITAINLDPLKIIARSLVPVRYGDDFEQMVHVRFYIMEQTNYDILLGNDFNIQTHPQINWNKQTVSFPRSERAGQFQPYITQHHDSEIYCHNHASAQKRLLPLRLL